MFRALSWEVGDEGCNKLNVCMLSLSVLDRQSGTWTDLGILHTNLDCNRVKAEFKHIYDLCGLLLSVSSSPSCWT